MQSEQGSLVVAIAASAVTIAEQRFLGGGRGAEKYKWALSFIYDRLDELFKWPAWVDWLAKDVVLAIAPALLQRVFDYLDKTGVVKRILGSVQ